ncbi:MAG: hypothetical protein KAS29_21045 [Bacteroidales bacterium]|nr:hypothetical protein [Bacteroidales bacterium]
MNTKKITVFLSLAIFACTVLTAQNFKYIGASKCKMCHNKPDKGEQYNIWAAGPHAKAMESLSAEEAKDPKCLKCHSTVGHIDASLVASIKVEEGVSCESCHGPGSAYKGASIMKSQELSLAKGLILPAEAVCVTCHNEESPDFKGFDYAEYSAKIAHPNPKAAE